MKALFHDILIKEKPNGSFEINISSLEDMIRGTEFPIWTQPDICQEYEQRFINDVKTLGLHQATLNMFADGNEPLTVCYEINDENSRYFIKAANHRLISFVSALKHLESQGDLPEDINDLFLPAFFRSGPLNEMYKQFLADTRGKDDVKQLRYLETLGTSFSGYFQKNGITPSNVDLNDMTIILGILKNFTSLTNKIYQQSNTRVPLNLKFMDIEQYTAFAQSYIQEIKGFKIDLKGSLLTWATFFERLQKDFGEQYNIAKSYLSLIKTPNGADKIYSLYDRLTFVNGIDKMKLTVALYQASQCSYSSESAASQLISIADASIRRIPMEAIPNYINYLFDMTIAESRNIQTRSNVPIRAAIVSAFYGTEEMKKALVEITAECTPDIKKKYLVPIPERLFDSLINGRYISLEKLLGETATTQKAHFVRAAPASDISNDANSYHETSQPLWKPNFTSRQLDQMRLNMKEIMNPPYNLELEYLPTFANLQIESITDVVDIRNWMIKQLDFGYGIALPHTAIVYCNPAGSRIGIVKAKNKNYQFVATFEDQIAFLSDDITHADPSCQLYLVVLTKGNNSEIWFCPSQNYQFHETDASNLLIRDRIRLGPIAYYLASERNR
jgi:hypothetical protein